MVRRSPQQRAQCQNNLRRINALDRENQDPRSSPISAVQQELARQRARADDNARRYRNKAREALRAKTTRDLLRAEKAQIYNAARAKAARVPKQKQHAVAKALEKAKAIPKERYMKKKGVVQEECRGMLRDLQTLNVPVEKLNEVVHVVGKGLGLKVMDNVSTRTIGRVMREGGVAAEMQIVHEIEQAKGMCLESTYRKSSESLMCARRFHGQWRRHHHQAFEL
jgi:hypothetical protein